MPKILLFILASHVCPKMVDEINSEQNNGGSISSAEQPT